MKTIKILKIIFAFLIVFFIAVLIVWRKSFFNNNSNQTGEKMNYNKEIQLKDNVLGVKYPPVVQNNSDAKKLKIKVWCDSGEDEITKKICKAYDDSNPDVDIFFEIGVAPYDSVKTFLDLGEKADVFMFRGKDLPEFVEKGYLLGFDDEINNDVNDKHISQAYEACCVNDKLYAIPFTTHVWYMFYNKSMYTEEEVKSLDTMFEKDFGDPKIHNVAVDFNDEEYLAGFFNATGCQLCVTDGTDIAKGDLTDEDKTAVVDYLKDKIKTNKLYALSDNPWEGIKNGTIGAYFTGSWNNLRMKEVLGENYAVACAPQIDINGKKQYIKPYGDYCMIGVSSKTENQKEAMEIANFLGSEIAQAVRAQVKDTQPTVKVLAESVPEGVDYKRDYQALYTSLEQMKHIVKQPCEPQFSDCQKTLEYLGECIFN